MGEHGYRPVPAEQIVRQDHVLTIWGRQKVTQVVDHKNGDITIHLANGKKLYRKVGNSVEMMRT